MSLRLIQLFFTLFLISIAVPSQAADVCPMCGGKLTTVEKVADDRAKPSKNLAVWNRSICGNRYYDENSLICTQCWFACNEQRHRWERDSELPDSFHVPLEAGIRKFPLPSAKDVKSLVVYSQQLLGTQITESVAFWCSDSSDLLTGFRKYTDEQGLKIRMDKPGQISNEVCIAVEAKPRAKPSNGTGTLLQPRSP